MEKAYLLLENGTVYEGEHFGASGESRGELVFTTGMTGCAESLTDPSYYGQIVIYTFPQLGNYGICRQDQESDRCVFRGVVAREYCKTPSNFRCEVSVDDFLKEQGVIGIAGVDTRALTQLLRDQGVMNALITTQNPKEAPADWKAYAITRAVEHTSVTRPVVRQPAGPISHRVALLDYGAKGSIADSLVSRGCHVTIYPYDTTAETILAAHCHGVMLSNGPGDPADNPFCIRQIQALLGRIPLFGICLGHQMMALAAGAATQKMKFGHRGANQPVKDLKTGRVYITSQNHGYAVEAASLAGTQGTMRFQNVNDGTCEGVDYPNAFSMQFHPEAHGGPLDCQDAFDRFLAMMDKEG